MRFPRRFRALFRMGIQAGTVAWSLGAPQAGWAYDHPLTDSAVRDAYFLGQDVTAANKFLAKYTQGLPVPAQGPQVAQIELSTPYAQAVAYSAQHTMNYSAQDAEGDYRKRGDSIEVRVEILFTPTYTGEEDFWRQVSVGLIQNKQHWSATSVSGDAIYASDQEGDSWVTGANVYVQFSAAGVNSDFIQVEVEVPRGAPVHAQFDLSTLR